MSLLKSDKALVKEFNITDELTTEEKKKYIDEQADSIKSMVWRLRVDALLNELVEPETENEKAERDAKVRSYKNDIRQMTKALDVLNGIKAEL